MNIVHIADNVLFFFSALFSGYLLFFALAARTYRKNITVSTASSVPDGFRKIMVLIPSYAEDSVVMDCVESFINQDYPLDKYEICVISDHMRDDTNQSLAVLPIRLEIALFPEGSTKVKALNLGMSRRIGFDIAVIMDADNTVKPDFLGDINLAFHQGAKVLQAHRMAKTTETPFQVLDAVSEEINNTLFRLGHSQAGLSTALIGSGMAFEYELFKQTLSQFNTIGGFDKELEHVYLREGYHFTYLQDTPVYDEKIKKPEAFAKQRKRWLSAQFVFLRRFAPEIPAALRKGNLDFLDKILQTAMPPRVLFLGGTFFLALLTLIVFPEWTLKWWALWATLCATLAISIPRSLWTKKLLWAGIYLGQAFFLMFLTLFHLKGANKKFIHTKHGE